MMNTPLWVIAVFAWSPFWHVVAPFVGKRLAHRAMKKAMHKAMNAKAPAGAPDVPPSLAALLTQMQQPPEGHINND